MKGEVECLIIYDITMVKIRLYKKIRDSDSGAPTIYLLVYKIEEIHWVKINGESSHWKALPEIDVSKKFSNLKSWCREIHV